MSALIEEMADNGPSSVLDLAEKINAEQGHFSLAEDRGRQGGSSRGTSGASTLGRGASGGGTSGASARETAGESAGRESSERRLPSDTLGEREPVDRVAPAKVPRPGDRRQDRREDGREERREERRGRRWRQAQPDHRAGEQTVEHVIEPSWDELEGGEQAPSAGFAAVLERIAREAGLATSGSEGEGAAPRTPEPAPASHADLILTELSDPRGLASPRGPAEERRATNEPLAHATPHARATATVDLAEPRVPAARREWTEPLWLPAVGERGEGGEPRWLAAPAVLARLSQPATEAAPQVAPEPASLAPTFPEPRLSQSATQQAPQPATQHSPQPATQPAPQPAWLAPTAPERRLPERRLPERAHQSRSLATTTPGQQLSELGLALQSLGVPMQACTAVTSEATRETIEGELRRALDLALPPLPAAPKSPSCVVAVVGPPTTVMSTAQSIARDLGASPDEVALATQRKVWRPQDRVILSAEVATEERRSWRWRDHPSVVAIEQDVRPERSAWTIEILQALEPTLCWGVAKASHKPEDLAAWSESLGGLDVLALVELDSTTTPAAALAAPVPVGRLDGEPATPALWATLLCARLMG
jgi:hypothetical protein